MKDKGEKGFNLVKTNSAYIFRKIILLSYCLGEYYFLSNLRHQILTTTEHIFSDYTKFGQMVHMLL